MEKIPEIMIVRYYEDGTIEVTYSNDGSEKNKNIIYKKLDKEYEEDKHLEKFEIFLNGENIKNEEERK